MGLLDISSVFFDDKMPDDYKNLIIAYRDKISQLEKDLSRIEAEIRKIKEEKQKIERYAEEQERITKNLAKKLTIESKTGLPNRLKLSQDFPDLFDIDSYQSSGKYVAILIIQLDKNYSVLTKTLPSSLVEWVIYQLGLKLRKIAEPNTVYHTKENEFIIILKDIDKIETARNYARDISNIIKKTENISGYHITIGSNIGIALFPDHGITKEQLLTSADIALGYAKERKLEYIMFEAEFKQFEMEKLELQNYIIKALEMNTKNSMDQQFIMYYQPIIHIGENPDGSLKIDDISAEALIRWNHPARGFINPDKFIPLSEETGIIVLLGNWIMYKVADMIAYWKDKYNVDIPVSVNVSSLQFNEGYIVDFIARVVNTKGINPNLLRVEVTETSLVSDPVEALHKMLKLRDSGIKVCIDDFGTGYSSFNYLRQFAIDLLKIDRSFIESIFHNSCDQAIIRAIIAMSSELSFDIVVEGVEDFNQFNFLYKEGCRKFQGFLFSKPLPPERFIGFYKNNMNKKIFS